MTPTDLETLRGLVELAQLVRPDPWMIVSDWHRYGVMQENHPHQRVVCTVNQRPVELQGRKIDPIDYVGADRIHAEFIAASRNAIPALTALLAEYERMREGLDNAIQQLSELAQPLTPALNGSYAKGEQVGYENAVRIISALCATLKGEKHE